MNKQQFDKKERSLSTRFTIFLSLFLMVGILGTAFIGRYVVKTYPVSLTQSEWGSRLQTIQNAKAIMRQSSLPASVVANWSDSLDVMAADIQKQVGAELQAEQKKDSTKPKK